MGRRSLAALAFAAASVASLASGQNIVMISIETIDGIVLDTASIDLEFVNQNFDSCLLQGISYLDVQVITSFAGTGLQSCLGFPLPGNEVPLFTVSNHGEVEDDDFGALWVRILTDDHVWIDCPGFFVNPGEIFDGECPAPGKNESSLAGMSP